MFQRLKGAIDSRIAEEQARQKAVQPPLSRSSSSARRSSSRTVSPSRRQGRARNREKGDSNGASKAQPDPSEFDPEFVIEDEDVTSRAATPVLGKERSEGAEGDDVVGKGKPLAEEPEASPELPTEVRAKLRKLEKLESRYQELLRSYRIAHARVSSIEPFETSLRENTPLTSISDPGALVEYLNQMNLKGDMVMDELKRVSNERDTFKQKLDEAEKKTKDAYDEVTNLRREGKDSGIPVTPSEQVNGSQYTDQEKSSSDIDADPLGASTVSPPSSLKSSTRAVLSPKPFEGKEIKGSDESEEFFSYDSELPRLENELKAREGEVSELRGEINTLQGDLAVARESTESMVQSLEGATRDLHALTDAKERQEDERQQEKIMMENSAEGLRSKLVAVEGELVTLKTERDQRQEDNPEELQTKLKGVEEELANLELEQAKAQEIGQQNERLLERINELELQLGKLQSTKTQSEKRIETLNGLVSNLKQQVKDAETAKELIISEKENISETLNATVERLQEEAKVANQRVPISSQSASASASTIREQEQFPTTIDTPGNVEATGTGKKRNKKKKKGGKNAAAVNEKVDNPEPVKGETFTDAGRLDGSVEELEHQAETEGLIAKSKEEMNSLHGQIKEKDEAINRLQRKIKDQEELGEEIEGLKDDLLNVGQEHVDAKDQVKKLKAQKTNLEELLGVLENEIKETRIKLVSAMEGSEKARNDLSTEFEDLKSRALILEIDLSAAEQLAASRFKDLTELRTIMQKAQPELVGLRNEVAELRVAKEELSGKSTSLSMLEGREKDLRAEISSLRREASERDTEVQTLKGKVDQETNNRLKAEDLSRTTQRDLRKIESDHREVRDTNERIAKSLATSEEDANASRAQIRDLEDQIAKLNSDTEGLRDDIELKTAQYAGAQSLMGSMRDQTAEIGMQMKEARDRCEGLEEELGDAHRLLSERSREGETMRRLLSDIEGRADLKIREMRERMELAIEERDRAEDEASTIGRRRAREIEELKGKVRDAERNLKRAGDDKEDFERAEKDWRKRREELEMKAEQSANEVKEVRQAMEELRDALDERERQLIELEKQKSDLRRSMEETQHRMEKLQKSNKSLSDDMRTLQVAKTKALDSSALSSRSSVDSSPSRAGLGSPAPKGRGTPASTETLSGPVAGAIDYVYLKNVLLQFLEQKDKKHQMQLIPVLGMLLHFDRKDEQKWMSAITTK
ncbi:MAG: hypothetical protein M1827_005936 [Pycnora praestabilis]|nr:MAG: hypothetical protein M1827_005936 [Pycnora praestabilis]